MNPRCTLALGHLPLLLLAAGGCSTTDPAKVIADARLRLATGDRVQAVFELREFARKRPAAAGDVQVLLAQLLLDQGDLAGAKQATTALDPKVATTAAAVTVRLQIAATAGHPDDVLAELSTHGDTLDASTRVVHEARALAALGRRQEAFDHLQAVSTTDPESVPVAVELASVRAALGDLSGAVHDLEGVVSRHHDPDALMTLGLLELRGENAGPAIKHLEESLAAASPAWPPTRRWRVELSLGDAYLSLHQLPECRTVVANLKKELPNAIAVRLLSGRLAMAEGRMHDAVSDLQPLARMDGVAPRVALMYATALASAGELEQARQVVGATRTRIAAAPSSEAWLALGSADLALQDLVAATHDADEAYRLAPSLRTAEADYRMRAQARAPEPERSLLDWIRRAPADSHAHTLLGAHYMQSGQPELARREFETAIANDAKAFIARNNLALILIDTDPNRAERLAREALAAAPDVPAVQDTLGWLLVREARYSESLPLLASAANRLRSDESVQFHYAVALGQNGRGAEAKMILETLLLSSRNTKLRADALQVLSSLKQPKTQAG